MCLTFFCLEPDTCPNIKLILGFNREEQTKRNTLKLNPYEEDKNIYAGRDIISGGTWLGVNIETGLLVILTNYDLEIFRYGLSRGQLVYNFLKTSFIPLDKRSQTDKIIKEQLEKIAKNGKQYSPFNLTICNLRTRATFYICSQRNQPNNCPVELKKGQTHGICNSDIETIWSKTALGLQLFKKLVSQLGQLNEHEIFEKMSVIFKNKQRFSQVDDDQSSIFILPYFCKAQQAERRTKTTLKLLLIEHEENYELLLEETTYSGENMNQSSVAFRLKLTK